MKILAIETSCDETAVAILEATGDEKHAEFIIRGDALLSQIEIHREYGGVFPHLAKREHAKNLVPLLTSALEEAEMLHESVQNVPDELKSKIAAMLEREPELDEQLQEFLAEHEVPDIDVIAVTYGPGLEPALWVGVNFARALSAAWGKPIVSINHMEGHILAGIAKREAEKIMIGNAELPILALLISGGHTELELMNPWITYTLVGQTRDDAVGEAFDKVARMLGLPYPGGPEISRLAEDARTINEENPYALPRPMIDSETGDFSFAGLKTAVLYLLKNNSELSDTQKKHIAREFEDAAAEVLWKKTSDAIESTGAQTVVVGGGVAANAHIRREFEKNIKNKHPQVALRIPVPSLTTDNAIMIGLAGFYRASRGEFADPDTLRANGNLSLANKP
ncbi:MAG TPA: tRNA (adenosine(37)-N6)-threonylcarbamoyltransferase complex transferase subunit TsaD [Candidatus Paceibacterota bacterium]|nr:tRNA (adenosine(37)-N6)-threonylcarbamoyltransferase complex transferase subunit TsaD [Candidatus Paceibacterota bacterium]